MRIATWFCTSFVIVYSCCTIPATTADAATVYRCVGEDGLVAFQDQPCLAGRRQSVLDIISHDPPVSSVVTETEKPGRPVRQQAVGVRRQRVAEATSFECRTNTGMVFYRHSRCPASLVDGTESNGRSRRVMVSSQGMDRREACRRMRNGARDGNQFDDKVSTYEHNLGRDICRNY